MGELAEQAHREGTLRRIAAGLTALDQSELLRHTRIPKRLVDEHSLTDDEIVAVRRMVSRKVLGYAD